MRKRSGGLAVENYEELLDEMRRRDAGYAIDAFSDLPPKEITMEGFEDDDDTPQLCIPCAKMLVLGASRTGKTSLINSYIQHAISERYEPTQGVEVKLHYTEVARTRVKQEIWDTSGDPAFQRHLEAYFRSAKAVMLVFDPSASLSFTYITKMIKLVPAAKAYLVVSHQIGIGEEVARSDVERFCRINKLKLLDANAATGWNVAATFYGLSCDALNLCA